MPLHVSFSLQFGQEESYEVLNLLEFNRYTVQFCRIIHVHVLYYCSV